LEASKQYNFYSMICICPGPQERDFVHCDVGGFSSDQLLAAFAHSFECQKGALLIATVIGIMDTFK
jgi:hypothetical protein